MSLYSVAGRPPAGGSAATALATGATRLGHRMLLADVQVLPPKGLNTSLYLDLNHFSQRTGWAHGFMAPYALWLGPVLLAALFVAAYVAAWWRRVPQAGALLALGGVGTLIALGLNQVVGHLAKELRPYVSHPQAVVLVAKANDYSFPSDHSIVAGGLTVSVLLIVGAGLWQRPSEVAADGGPVPVAGLGTVRVLAAASVVLGLFLCFARVYVGAHYPGDVVAGYLLAAVLVIVASMLRPIAFRIVALVEPTPVGVLVRRPRPVKAN
jgi:undecaprenyl-diphosphatase